MFYCTFRCNRKPEISKVEDDQKKLVGVARESVMLTQFHDSYVRYKHHSDKLKVSRICQVKSGELSDCTSGALIVSM